MTGTVQENARRPADMYGVASESQDELSRRAVRVPYSVIYDPRGDQISKLRIYLPLSVLVEQITT